MTPSESASACKHESFIENPTPGLPPECKQCGLLKTTCFPGFVWQGCDWDSWTTEQKVEWLATEVMGWHLEPSHPMDVRRGIAFWRTKDGGLAIVHHECTQKYHWNPLESWNHWRQVEQKILEQRGGLWWRFLKNIEEHENLDLLYMAYISADLPTRARALFIAYQAMR